MSRAGLALAAALAVVAPTAAHAFCGFYVAGADTKLFNDATMVVMMRDKMKTILSMRNDYKGPPEDFAMVVPVPVVLQKENVKTLSAAIFDHIDLLAAPRLVEYWEQDPCQVQRHYPRAPMKMAAGAARGRDEEREDDALGVKIEAQFTVGEYEIVILSAQDSGGLDTWLRKENYKIPAGAEAALRPYVAAGSKFFVAKVDAQKVTFEGGRARLSPLRFQYETDQFTLPVRLGMLNSSGTQDLLVHILSAGQRYEVANYPNVTIPTNIEVLDRVRKAFGGFYAALFDRTLARHKGAVVTEYAWDAMSCDPCPTPPLTEAELMTLGADTLTTLDNRQFTLTRLHARYGKGALGEDLIFREAGPIVGGREMQNDRGKLEQGSVASSVNNFQARYIIRHFWNGPIACKSPQRGIWGGPPNERRPRPVPALNLAYAPRRAVSLPNVIRQNIPEIGVRRAKPKPKPPATTPTPTPTP